MSSALKKHEKYMQFAEKRRAASAEYHQALSSLHSDFLQRKIIIQEEYELKVRKIDDELFFALNDINIDDINNELDNMKEL